MKQLIQDYKGKIVAGIGMILTCGGSAISNRAGYWLNNGEPFWNWFLLGTLGLTVLGAGVSLAISGTIEYDHKKKKHGRNVGNPDTNGE